MTSEPTTKAMVRTESQDISLGVRDMEYGFALAAKQRELVEGWIKDRLKPGKHFYKTTESDKDNLNKEGAELICLPHGYKPGYDQLAGPHEPPENDMPYQITVKCRLLKGDLTFAGEGLGSASSHQTTRSGDYKPRQKDPGLCHNATLKMAMKSAYIAATLSSTAASEFFTQDLEDDGSGGHRQTPSQDKTDHWCEEHQTKWFKTEKMRNYAHSPTKKMLAAGEKDWCNEPSKKATVVDSGTPTPAPAPVPPEEAPSRSGTGQEGPAVSKPEASPVASPAGTSDPKGFFGEHEFTVNATREGVQGRDLYAMFGNMAPSRWVLADKNRTWAMAWELVVSEKRKQVQEAKP